MAGDMEKLEQEKLNLIKDHENHSETLKQETRDREDDIKHWEERFNELEAEFTKNMNFKKGSHEYEIMVKRIAK